MRPELLAVFFITILVISPVFAQDEAADAERARMEEKKREFMQKLEQEKAKFQKQCQEDPDSCDCNQALDAKSVCSQAPDAEGAASCESGFESGFRECLAALNEGKKQAEEERKKMEAACQADPDSCDCSTITTKKDRETCERELRKGKQEAQQEKDKIKRECVRNPDQCDCNQIQNEKGKQECEAALNQAREQKTRIEQLCRQNVQACDCGSIENESGRKECEDKRAEGLKQMSDQIKEMIIKCWDNVRECPCESIPDEPIKQYCVTQRTYGINCLDYGEDCDKIDEASFISAPGVPEILKPLFRETIQSHIKTLKGKALSDARATIETCVRDPENCDCSQISKQAITFCEEKKDLGTRCKNNDYTACIELDKTPRLPPGIPEFSRGPLENVVEGFVKIQKALILSGAAPVVSNTVVKCVDDPKKCDCSIAPEGEFRSFCEYKKNLAISCVDGYDYKSCYTVTHESLLPEATPQIIRDYFEKNARQKVEQRMQEYYDKMRPPDCEDKTMDNCFKTGGYA